MPLSVSQTRELLTRLGHEPRKQLGQNFLIDGNIVQKSLRMADLRAGESVVEVGPGLGTLTEAMLEKGAHVYAVEFDRRLHKYLSENLCPRYPDAFRLLYADALHHPLAQLPVNTIHIAETPAHAQLTNPAATQTDVPPRAQADATTPTQADTTRTAQADHTHAAQADHTAPTATRTGDFKIIANLPYAISTPWLEAVLSGPLRPRRMVLMLQKEAAERFIAQPGSKTYGAISIFTASAYRMATSHAVSRQCFYPVPGVDSVLLCLEALPTPCPWPPRARHFVRQFFIHRRKQIGSLVRRAAEECAAPQKNAPRSKDKAATAANALATTDIIASNRFMADDPSAANALATAGIAANTSQSDAQHLHDWLAALQERGVASESRPEAIPLESWQDLARRFSSLPSV